jgi:hypothetical protein
MSVILFACHRNTNQITDGASYMAKNHYSTKPKRRNRSGKRKDTQRIAANMAKIKTLERSSATQKNA